jgi:hypothetical protein
MIPSVYSFYSLPKCLPKCLMSKHFVNHRSYRCYINKDIIIIIIIIKTSKTTGKRFLTSIKVRHVSTMKMKVDPNRKPEITSDDACNYKITSPSCRVPWRKLCSRLSNKYSMWQWWGPEALEFQALSMTRHWPMNRWDIENNKWCRG